MPKLETVVVAMGGHAIHRQFSARRRLGMTMVTVRRLCLTLLTLLLVLPASASAVVGGRDATKPYPYMVALEYDAPGGTSDFSRSAAPR